MDPRNPATPQGKRKFTTLRTPPPAAKQRTFQNGFPIHAHMTKFPSGEKAGEPAGWYWIGDPTPAECGTTARLLRYHVSTFESGKNPRELGELGELGQLYETSHRLLLKHEEPVGHS